MIPAQGGDFEDGRPDPLEQIEDRRLAAAFAAEPQQIDRPDRDPTGVVIDEPGDLGWVT
jgi:hypothetical protein